MNDTDLPTGSVPLTEAALTSRPTGSVPLSEATVAAALPSRASAAYVKPSPIDATLPDGRVISMAPPNASLSTLIAMVLADSKLSPQLYEIEKLRVKCLLYITHIDGVERNKISDSISRASLEEAIGEEFLDVLFAIWFEHFPSVELSQVKIVKKS